MAVKKIRTSFVLSPGNGSKEDQNFIYSLSPGNGSKEDQNFIYSLSRKWQ